MKTVQQSCIGGNMSRKKWSLQISISVIVVSLLFISLLSVPTLVFSQNNPTATFVGDIVQSAGKACENIQRGEVCLGSKSISVTNADGTEAALDAPGDVVTLNTVATVTSQPADQKTNNWGITYLRLGAGLPDRWRFGCHDGGTRRYDPDQYSGSSR